MIDSVYGEIKKINERSFKFIPKVKLILKDNRLMCGEINIIPEDLIIIDNIKSKINRISQDGDGSYTLSECDHHKLSLVALPLLLNNAYVGKLIKPYLYNCYVNKKVRSFYVVLRLSTDESYMEVEDKLTKNPSYVDNENLGNNLISFHFKLKDSQYRSILRIVKGRYSKLLEKDKNIILDYYNKNKTIDNILYPTVSSRNKLAEYLDVDLSMITEIISKPLITEYYEEYCNN